MISEGISPMHLTLLIVVSIGIIGAITYVCICPPKNEEMDSSNDYVQENQKSDEIAICKGIDDLLKTRKEVAFADHEKKKNAEV